MRLRGSHPVNATDRGLRILAAWLGAMVGGVVVGGSAVLIARVAGVDGSLADYGLPYQLLLGGACLGAALGCYLALRATRQGRALSSAAILFVLLAPSALLAARRAHSGPGWPSTWELAFGFLIFVALPLAAPAIAVLLAEAMARLQTSQ